VREKWGYIDNLKFSENFKIPFKNTNTHILESSYNIHNNINFNKLKINQNKLRKILIQILQLKRYIINYYSNILANIYLYLLQYNEENNFMQEKHKINDIIQLKDQLNQQKDNLFQYIDNILENKSREYVRN